jgi:hypothetical protein
MQQRSLVDGSLSLSICCFRLAFSGPVFVMISPSKGRNKVPCLAHLPCFVWYAGKSFTFARPEKVKGKCHY